VGVAAEVERDLLDRAVAGVPPGVDVVVDDPVGVAAVGGGRDAGQVGDVVAGGDRGGRRRRRVGVGGRGDRGAAGAADGRGVRRAGDGLGEGDVPDVDAGLALDAGEEVGGALAGA